MEGGEREKLVAFIRAAKNAGAGDAFLVDLLKENGWSERRIYAAFSDYYAQSTGSPVPSRGYADENARDAFLYLIAFASLGFWSIALIWLADIVLQLTFPSPTDIASSNSLRQDLSGQLASIIIGFPVFMFVSWLLARQTGRRPEALDSGVRKWLTYVALVVAAIALISDAVLFLRSFLTYALTTRFALQYLVLIVVAGGIFWYYLGSMRSAQRRGNNVLFGGLATAAVVAALFVGFTGIGTPGYERPISLDNRRLDDLYAIAQKIHEQGSAPKSLTSISANLDDPVTHSAYGYSRLNAKSYRLCAIFDTSTQPNRLNDALDDAWAHPSGHYCFKLDASTAPSYPNLP